MTVAYNIKAAFFIPTVEHLGAIEIKKGGLSKCVRKMMCKVYCYYVLKNTY